MSEAPAPTSIEEMGHWVPAGDPEPEPEFWTHDPRLPLYKASVEKNSRGYTWKVEIGSEGVDWLTAYNGLKAAAADMAAHFGGPDTKG